MAKNNNLTDFVTDVADAIRAKKRISALIDPQDFSSEIASIPSSGGYEVESIDNGDGTQTLQINDNGGGGGGSMPSNLTELKALINEFFDTVLIEQNSTRYTPYRITLYTPDADCKKYFIRKRSDNGKYSVVWFNDVYLVLEILGSGAYGSVNSFRLSGQFDRPENTGAMILNRPSHSTPTISVNLYYSRNYDTLQEAIDAIQNSSTIYTAWTSGDSVSNENGYKGYSNFGLGTNSNSIYTTSMFEFPKLSDSETIEVIV